MTDTFTTPIVEHAPSLAPVDFVEILQEADGLLALMGSESLDVVADLANTLTTTALSAGAWRIADAASVVQHIASGHHPVTLTHAMQDLTDAIARAKREYHLEP